MGDGKAFGIPSFDAADRKIDKRLRESVGHRVAVLERILAMREQELMDRQGPCAEGSCGLWRGHYGPCAIKKVEIKRPKEKA
jgi:hypothetical protein